MSAPTLAERSKDININSPCHRAALAYARRGLPVFPCLENSKEPASRNGHLDATTDEATINRWFAGGADFNIACCPDDAGFCVVDLDGDLGAANWHALEDEHGAVETRLCRTPSGGLHLWFKGALRNSASKIAKNIDTRGRDPVTGKGGYVLLPPSYVIETKKGYEGGYAWEGEHPPAPLPAWIEERVNTPTRGPRKAPEGIELDTPAAIQRGEAYLRRVDPPAEGTRNNDCVLHANYLGDLGISEAETVALIEAVWCPRGVAPDEAIDFIVRSAYRSRQNGIGSNPPSIPYATRPPTAPSGCWATWRRCPTRGRQAPRGFGECGRGI